MPSGWTLATALPSASLPSRNLVDHRGGGTDHHVAGRSSGRLRVRTRRGSLLGGARQLGHLHEVVARRVLPQLAENAVRALLFLHVMTHFVADLRHERVELVGVRTAFLQ